MENNNNTTILKDHREIGRELNLFIFNEVAPGAVFWLPKGQIIFNQLEKWLRELYKKEDIQEISTPFLVNKKLWERSGHWEKFKENMFVLKDGEQEFALKPMNCPEAAIIFESDIRSYKSFSIFLRSAVLPYFCCKQPGNPKKIRC